MISCSLSPNTEADDVWLALKTMLMPWTHHHGNAVDQVEQWFCRYFSVSEAVSFNSARSALLGILKSFGIGTGDEVLVQAFTCVAVPNSVLWAGAKPVFVDIDATLNIDVRDAEKKITPKTKAIIVQHTFGIPANMNQLVVFAKKHGLYLIEDCSHSLGATYQGKKVGSFGDAAFFSFGRDKVVSSVWGGVAVMRAKSKEQRAKLKTYQNKLPYPSRAWIAQQLLHPIVFFLILASYNWAPLSRRFTIGKVLLFLLQRLHLLSFPVYPEEKRGRKPIDFPARFPNALAVLALNQLHKLDRYNETRKTVASYYMKQLRSFSGYTLPKEAVGSIYLRFPVLMDDPIRMIALCKRNGVLLGDWYHHVIDPAGVSFDAVGYVRGSCPNAEAAALRILNLPTRITHEEAACVVGLL